MGYDRGMAKKRLEMTSADYVTIALSPVLIMIMVGSLVFFLLELFYDGIHEARLTWIMFWFVFATVLVARIAIEEGSERAGIYGLALALAVAVTMVKFVDKPWLAWALLALVWWSANKLTWDCTLIDDTVDASGQGLLQAAGFDRAAAAPARNTPAHSADASLAARQRASRTARAENRAATGDEAPVKVKSVPWWRRLFVNASESKDQPHAPGLWVVYFSLAALPLFGLGQLLIPRADEDRRSYAFWLLMAYVASGLGLLLTTSFLGLRRYLRQRKLQMPDSMTGIWLGVGTALIVAMLFVGLLLPRTSAELADAASWNPLGSPDRDASSFAPLKDGPGKGPGSPGSTRPEESQRDVDPKQQQSGSSADQGSEKKGAGAASGKGEKGGKSSGSGDRDSGDRGSGQQDSKQNSQGGSSENSSSQSKSQGGQPENKGSSQGKSSAGQGAGKQQAGDKKSPGQSSGSQGGQDKSAGGGAKDKSGGDSNDPSNKGRSQPSSEKQGPRPGESDQRHSERDPSDAQKGDLEKSTKQQQDASSQEKTDPDKSNSDPQRSGEPQAGGGRPPQTPPRALSQPSTSPPPGSSVFSWLNNASRYLKWLVYLALLLVGLYILKKHGKELLATLRQMWRELLDFLRGLLGQGPKPAAEVAATAAPAKIARPFSSYANPFQNGEANRSSPNQVVEYSFEALQAWATEQGIDPRPEETPLEFAGQLGQRVQPLATDANELARLYSQVAYARASLARGSLSSVERLWSLLYDRRPAPHAAPAPRA